MKEQLESIAHKVNELAALCERLDNENKSLRKRENEWLNEKRQLLIKNESARSKVEAMIGRLKAMETSA